MGVGHMCAWGYIAKQLCDLRFEDIKTALFYRFTPQISYALDWRFEERLKIYFYVFGLPYDFSTNGPTQTVIWYSSREWICFIASQVKVKLKLQNLRVPPTFEAWHCLALATCTGNQFLDQPYTHGFTWFCYRVMQDHDLWPLTDQGVNSLHRHKLADDTHHLIATPINIGQKISAD